MPLTLIVNDTQREMNYIDTDNPPVGFAPIPLSIRRVRLNSGGYDRHGEYFGNDAPLYAIDGDTADGNEIHLHMRDCCRANVCARIRAKYGKLVTFKA